ncbi:hypothetical protein MTO96_028304 [Rhipicephalus appendiculatus]
MDSHNVQAATIPEEDDKSISSPWIEVTRRANRRSPTPQRPSVIAPDQTPPKSPFHRSSGPRQPKQPPLPTEDYKKINVGGNTYEVAAYPVAPDNSCKGVIYNIGIDCSVEEVWAVIEAPGYEVLSLRRLGSSSALVITFKDVCPNSPETPRCKDFGVTLSGEQHECHPHADCVAVLIPRPPNHARNGSFRQCIGRSLLPNRLRRRPSALGPLRRVRGKGKRIPGPVQGRAGTPPGEPPKTGVAPGKGPTRGGGRLLDNGHPARREEREEAARSSQHFR